ncbi:F-box only protein 18 [Oryzias melastigma]|uniref:F-box only protein 18 n=1 Tax=Oryzias melastigma TaxID=30732 RepID=A0A834BNN4_ORYME|nr:F-box only protein 18 [Oryzias melastigma]
MEVAAKGRAKRKHLDARDCAELGRSANGTDVLTQPHTSNHALGKRNPNRGLYPRSPAKRKKPAAAASGSPCGKQQPINSFFSVTKVLSSSPLKSPRPSTSGFPCQQLMDADEEEDDDDASLLAASVEAEAVAADDEEEIDDTSLLAAERLQELDGEKRVCVDSCRLTVGVEHKETVNLNEDPLEGMTAEMFGDDEEFEKYGIDDDEEEVEPLPDAHYGLLGSNSVLQEPQGCMDDLPEEVLEQILSLVPAPDLYRSVSIVCHRWKNIVENPKFVPYKKQYYRYTMREVETVQKIVNILKNSGMIGARSSDHCIRSLILLMAQHEVGERVRPEDVLECVKKHRLYPQAEASIRLRVPDVQKFFHVNSGGPNPYAAMAAILVLSESVGDVEDLVFLLRSSISLTAVTEFLSHMATMLLALDRNRVQISNRLHYNIYYVLHLMENGPFVSGSAQDGHPQIYLTREQQQILSHKIQQDHVVKIIAFAGTGKTTTLMKFAEQRPHLRFLYVAFNNSVACEARRRFPSNVDCKTVHSLAYKDVGKRYALNKKLSFNLAPFSINCVLPSGRGGFTKAKVVTTTLKNFMASTDAAISTEHVPNCYPSSESNYEWIPESEQQLFAEDAKEIWRRMKDLKEKSKHAYYMPHDGYLKLWQLQDPKPCLSDRYDVLFIDEAQDCTPAILDVLLSQRCGKVLVGDPHQQIYTFKGAINALEITRHTHVFYLTQSFRFGAEIAYVGATVLKVCKRVNKILVGGKQSGNVCDQSAAEALVARKTGLSQSRGKIGILSRCNFTVFVQAVNLTNANPLCRIHFIGGVKRIGLEKIMDIFQLLNQDREKRKPNSIRDPLIRCFSFKKENGFQALKKYVLQTDDKELEGKLTIVERYQKNLPEVVNRLEACSESDMKYADFIPWERSTKLKGWSLTQVIMTDDFTNIQTSRHNTQHSLESMIHKIPADEWNLIYVAVTRARRCLVFSNTILHLLTVAGEYFLKSEMPVAGSGPPPCSVSDCPNCLTPGSAFIMSKKKIYCTEGVTFSGPLCERCVWVRVGPVAFLMTDDVLSMAEIPRGPQPAINDRWIMVLL